MDDEVQSVRRAASRAWHSIERKHRRALETAIETREKMEELEGIIRDLGPSGKEPPPNRASNKSRARPRQRLEQSKRRRLKPQLSSASAFEACPA